MVFQSNESKANKSATECRRRRRFRVKFNGKQQYQLSNFQKVQISICLGDFKKTKIDLVFSKIH